MGGPGGGTSTSIQDIPREFKPAFTQLFNSAFGAARASAGQPGFGSFGTPGAATSTANAITGFGSSGSPSPFSPPGGVFDNPFSGSFQQPNPNIFSGPTNTTGAFTGGQQAGKGLPEQGTSALDAPEAAQQTGDLSGAKGGPEQQQAQNIGGKGGPEQVAAPPPDDILSAVVDPLAVDPLAPGVVDPINAAAEVVPDLFGQEVQVGEGAFEVEDGVSTEFNDTIQPIVPGEDEDEIEDFINKNPETGPETLFPGSLEEGTTGLNNQGKVSTSIPLAAGPPIVSPAFGEQFTAGTSPFEFESLAQKEALARQLEGIGNPLLNLGNFTAQGGFLDPASNPFLVENIKASLNPIIQNFQNSTVPNFNSQAIQSGAFKGSSNRDLAFNQLAAGFGKQLLDTGTGIAFDNYQRERVLQQNAGQLLDQGALLNQLSPELLAQVGLGQRELAQRPLDEALLQFQEQINAPFRSLFPLASIIQGGDIGSAFSTTVPGPSQLSGGIVGALGGAGAGASIFDLLGGDAGGSGGELSALLGALAGGTAGALG